MFYHFKERKLIFLLYIAFGIAISFGVKRVQPMDYLTFISNTLFIISLLFLISSMAALIMNLGFFNGLFYGARIFKNIFYNKLEGGDQIKDDYVSYSNSRRNDRDTLSPLVMFGIFFALSITLTALF